LKSCLATAVVSCYGDVIGSLLLPLLAALNAFSGTIDGGFGGHGPDTVGCRPRIALDEGGPKHLFTRSMSSCDVEQLLGGFWLFAAELMNQVVARHAIPECQDDVNVGHTRKLVALL
jgi:hypothetical protein